MFIVDGHLDLAYNALNFGRNLSHTIADIRSAEKKARHSNGAATVSVPALIEGKVAIVFATLFAMPASISYAFPDSLRSYNDDLPLKQRQEGAHREAVQQLDYYYRLADADERVVIIKKWVDVEEVLASYETETPKVGFVIHLEGAEPIRDPGEMEMWYERGLRSVGLAWHDTRYAPGQWREAGALPRDGYRLLERMAQYNMLVDLTHISEKASFNVLESYEGPIIASHCNARALVNTPRQLSDKQIHLLAERDGLIGVVLFNKFLREGAEKNDHKELTTIQHAVAHIDHICQLLGNADHVGIGSDWDGGFGWQDIPFGMDNSADLPQLATALKAYGYDQTSIEKIMSGNWLKRLQQILT